MHVLKFRPRCKDIYIVVHVAFLSPIHSFTHYILTYPTIHSLSHEHVEEEQAAQEHQQQFLSDQRMKQIELEKALAEGREKFKQRFNGKQQMDR